MGREVRLAHITQIVNTLANCNVASDAVIIAPRRGSNTVPSAFLARVQ